MPTMSFIKCRIGVGGGGGKIPCFSQNPPLRSQDLLQPCPQRSALQHSRQRVLSSRETEYTDSLRKVVGCQNFTATERVCQRDQAL